MIYSCPYCSSKFSCEGHGGFVCPTCGKKVRVDEPPGVGCDFDRVREKDFIGSFFRTFTSALGRPVEFFGSVSAGSGLVRPFIFVIVVYYVIFLASFGYQLGFQSLAAGFDLAGDLKGDLIPLAASLPFALVVVLIVMIVGVPMIAALSVAARTLLYHVCLIVVGAANRDIAATARCICYSSGPQLFQIVPVLGGLVGVVYEIVLNIVGLKVIHRTTYGKSALAVFLPTLVCCGLAFIAVAAVAGAICAAAISGRM